MNNIEIDLNAIKTNLTQRDEFEILVRKRGENTYAAYCPQLNIVRKGAEHEEVVGYIENDIEYVLANQSK